MSDCVDGDPADMRDLAATLRAEADRLGSVADGIGSSSATMEFEAPAADRIRGDLGDRCSALTAHAAELQDLAAALEAGAAEVEAALRAAQAGVI